MIHLTDNGLTQPHKLERERPTKAANRANGFSVFKLHRQKSDILVHLVRNFLKVEYIFVEKIVISAVYFFAIV